MLILARMWIFQYLWYWPKVEPIKMQISAKWKVSENRESLTDRGFPQTPALSQLRGKCSEMVARHITIWIFLLWAWIMFCVLSPLFCHVLQWKTELTHVFIIFFYFLYFLLSHTSLIILLSTCWNVWIKLFVSKLKKWKGNTTVRWKLWLLLILNWGGTIVIHSLGGYCKDSRGN